MQPIPRFRLHHQMNGTDMPSYSCVRRMPARSHSFVSLNDSPILPMKEICRHYLFPPPVTPPFYDTLHGAPVVNKKDKKKSARLRVHSSLEVFRLPLEFQDRRHTIALWALTDLHTCLCLRLNRESLNAWSLHVPNSCPARYKYRIYCWLFIFEKAESARLPHANDFSIVKYLS